jgi:hypothetical protein
MLKLKSLLCEEFERPSGLFNNPAYDDVLWADILKKFESEGGKVEGQGKFGMVLSHPRWGYVLKIFANDDYYLRFIRFAMKHPNRSFPQVLDKPRKIIPHFKRTRETQFLYLVPIEKLYPISKSDWEDIKYYLYYGPSDNEYAFELSKTMPNWADIIKNLERLERKYPEMQRLKSDYDIFRSTPLEGSEDFTQSNFMKRENGEFVITDPLWQGETPYQTHDRLMRAEMGYNDDPVPPEYIRGGKKWKRPKRKKTSSPEKRSELDDVPF